MAIEITGQEAASRFRARQPERKPKSDYKAPPERIETPPSDNLALKAQAGQLAELEGRVGELVEVLLGMAEEDLMPKAPVTAEVFYSADGRVKSMRMGKFGATVSRDGEGRLRTIDVQEIT